MIPSDVFRADLLT